MCKKVKIKLKGLRKLYLEMNSRVCEKLAVKLNELKLKTINKCGPGWMDGWVGGWLDGW